METDPSITFTRLFFITVITRILSQVIIFIWSEHLFVESPLYSIVSGVLLLVCVITEFLCYYHGSLVQ